MTKMMAGLALLGVFAVPAMGQNPNLLLNPGFDVVVSNPTPPPDNQSMNAVIWIGDYAINGYPNAPLMTGSYGSRSHNPTPLYQSPIQIWESSTDPGSGGETHTLWQTVAVSNGATVSFHAWVDTGPELTATETFTVNLYDNDGVGGTPIGTAIYDGTGTEQAWVEVNLTATAPAVSGHVTVEIIANVLASTGVAALHVDSASLTSNVACSNAHSLGTDPVVAPNPIPHNADTAVTITGGAGNANMANITGVKLIQVESQLVIVCTNVVAAAGSVSFTAPIWTNDPKGLLGDYTIITEQEDCVAQTIVDGVTVTCANESTLGSVEPSSADEPQTTLELRIKGANLVELSDLTLTLGGYSVVGYSAHMDGNDLLATFDFSGAPTGMYTLSATRADACENPVSLPNAFELVRTFPCNNLLVNGNFEAEGPYTLPVDRRAITVGWTKKLPSYGADTKYNNDVHVPSAPYVIDGTGRAQMQACCKNYDTWYQTVPVNPGETTYLDGYMHGCTSGTVQYERFVRIRDGGPNDSELARYSATECISFFEPFSLVVVPTQSTVTVEWGLRHIANDNMVGMSVDALRLCQYEPCAGNYGYADFDKDEDVDQEDFGLWQLCYTGTGGGLLGGDICLCADFDDREKAAEFKDVDYTDFQTFSGCATGPDIPQTDPDCAAVQACCNAQGSPGCSMRGKGSCTLAGGTSYDGEDCATFTCP